MKQLVDVYPYKKSRGDLYFFLGKRSEGKIYEKQWRMVGGKLEHNEAAWQAALRELKEELGVAPAYFWSPPTLNQFYETATDTIHHIPVFAAEINPEVQITLNEEHQQYKWISIEQIEDFIVWPEQIRIMKLIHEIIFNQSILKEWEVPVN